MQILMPMLTARRLMLAMLIALLVTGCGDSGPGAQATGTVTLDGQPLTSGVINFLPTDGQGASAGAEIKDGSFTLELPPGEKMVAIVSEKVVGQKLRSPNDPKSEKFNVTKQIIPDRFNSRTELKATIQEGDNQNVAFTITSK